MFEALAFLFFLALVACAITGVVTILRWLFSSGGVKSGEVQAGDRGRRQAGQFCEQLDWLYRQGLISHAAYAATRLAVGKAVGEQFELPPMLAEIVVDQAQSSAGLEAAEVISEPLVRTGPPIPELRPARPGRDHEPAVELLSVAESAATVASAETVPWEGADPPARKRTPWRVMIRAFMEKRNIRWGEIASGILIVGSAIGLVLSLRRELSDTIPYFPALLFTLFTLALHGAGAYTLKQWKLRSTSRGLLCICLLVVPLNFLAAALLSAAPEQQRAWSDPLLWLALVAGTGLLGWISWRSSRLVLRKGAWLPTLATTGAGLSVVLANRAHELVEPLQRWWLAVPAAGLGAGLFLALESIVRRRRALTPATLNRLWTLAAIILFSITVAMLLFPLHARAESNIVGSLAAPASFCLVAALAWAMALLGRTRATAFRMHHLAAGGIVASMGLGLVLLSTFAGAEISTCTTWLAAVGGTMLAVAFARQLTLWLPVAMGLLTFAAIILVRIWTGHLGWRDSFGLAGLAPTLFSGQAALTMLAGGLVNAAWTPLVRRWNADRVVGQPVASQFPNRQEKGSDPKSLRRLRDLASDPAGFESAGNRSAIRHLLASLSLVIMGSAFGLVAARLNPASLFDTTVGTGLLVALALLLLAMAQSRRLGQGLQSWLGRVGLGRSNRTASQKSGGMVLAIAASLASLLAGLEAWFLNPFLFQSVGAWRPALESRGLAAMTSLAVVLGCAAVVARRRRRGLTRLTGGDGTGDELPAGGRRADALPLTTGVVATFAIATAMAVAAGLVVGWGTVGDDVSLATIVCAGLLLAAAIASAFAFRERMGWFFEWASLPVVLLCGADWFQRVFTDKPVLGPQSVLFLFWTLAGWCLGWLVLRGLPLTWTAWREASGSRLTARPLVEHAALLGAVLLLVWTGFGMVPGVVREVLNPWLDSVTALHDLSQLKTMALVTLGVWAITLTMVFLRAGSLTLFQMTLLAIAGLGLVGASWWSDEIAVATAIRWLMAAVGLILSLGFWLPRRAVDATGVRLGVLSPGWFDGQWRLESALAAFLFSTTCSLSVALVAVSGFMMLGPEAIGGPRSASWIGSLRRDVSYGIPIGLILLTCLSYAWSLRRLRFAWAGSIVLQSIVVVQLVLLALSPHPKLASEWFVSIVQSVSIAMTFYGLAWHAMRKRLAPEAGTAVVADSADMLPGGPDLSALARQSGVQIHALVNLLLITGLAGLILFRHFSAPGTSAGWISSSASSLGILAALILSGLLWILFGRGRSFDPGWLVAAVLVVTTAFVAANVDRYQSAGGWWAYRAIVWGLIVAAALQIIWRTWIAAARGFQEQFAARGAPVLVSALLAILFAVRGFVADPTMVYGWAGAVAAALFCITAVGVLARASWIGWLGAGVAALWGAMLVSADATGWFSVHPVDAVHGLVSAVVAFATIWLGAALWLRYAGKSMPQRGFTWVSSVVALLGSIWLLVSPPVQALLLRLGGTSEQLYFSPGGLVACLAVTALIAAQWWNDRARLAVLTRCLATAAVPGMLTLEMAGDVPFTLSRWLLMMAGVVGLWGARLHWSRPLNWAARTMRMPRVSAGLANSRRQTPVYGTIVGMVVAVLALWVVLAEEDRVARFVSAFAVVGLAASQVVFAGANGKRVCQVLALLGGLLGAVMLSWADLDGSERAPLTLWSRLFAVTAGASFLMGVMGNRWLWAGASWHRTLRWGSGLVTAFSVVVLGLILALELGGFQRGPAGSMPPGEAWAVFMAGLVLVTGLVWVASVARFDPFALSNDGRQVYVYLAQLVLVMAGVHAVATMPWLLRLGLRDYWPYLAMLVAFGGIGLSEWLRRQRLRTLSEPLANTMSFLPALAASASLAVTNRADLAVTLLLAGLVGVATSMIRRSYWSGIASVVFGNLALWVFYRRWPGLDFLAHPQLWLIPPALCVLVLLELGKARFRERERRAIRYLALAVIYVSSTSEVFIAGLGDQLWPPMILAVLSVAGMLAGMLLKSRVAVGMGVVFLLLSVTAMVAHAQRRIGHVWPWWAFGITLGIIILSLFGYFERRRNLLKQDPGQAAIDGKDRP